MNDLQELIDAVVDQVGDRDLEEHARWLAERGPFVLAYDASLPLPWGLHFEVDPDRVNRGLTLGTVIANAYGGMQPVDNLES